MFADSDTLQRQVAIFFGDGDQAEVGGSAADVADQDEVSDLDALAPVVALALEPCVERGLRFFEERHALQPGLLGRAPGQLARFLVERSGHGEQNVLLAESVAFAVGRVLCVPDRPQVLQILR